MNKPNHISLVTQVYKQLLLQKKVSSYEVSKQTGIDKTYLSKLAGGKIKKPGQDKLIRIAQVLNIDLKQLQKVFIEPDIAAKELNLGQIDLSQPTIKVNARQDWGNAPDGLVCYGREPELATLTQRILENGDLVVTLYGLSGTGKTTLAIKLAQQLQIEFDYVFWRSLHYAPSIETIIREILTLVGVKTKAESSYRQQISLLFSRLRIFRCLIVFDHVESILATGNSQKEYQVDYQLYGEFLRQMTDSQHKSCLLLVSNEKLREMAIRECSSTGVYSLQVEGVNTTVARDILREKELPEEEKWDELIEAYRGHPLTLKIVATTIKEVFNGSTSEFLRQNTLFLGDFAFVLAQEFQRLSDTEKKLMCAISKISQPASMIQLKKDFGDKIHKSEIVWGLDTLTRRSLVEVNQVKSITLYSLHPVIKKYMNTQI